MKYPEESWIPNSKRGDLNFRRWMVQSRSEEDGDPKMVDGCQGWIVMEEGSRGSHDSVLAVVPLMIVVRMIATLTTITPMISVRRKHTYTSATTTNHISKLYFKYHTMNLIWNFFVTRLIKNTLTVSHTVTLCQHTNTHGPTCTYEVK